jgi:hypothetical protein
MGAEVKKLREALSNSAMAGVVRGHGTLTALLNKYYGELESTGDGENISSEPMDWRWN